MNLASSLNHPLRLPLAAEVHSRPFVVMEAPAQISHLAVFINGAAAQPHMALLASLCERFGVAAPAVGAAHFFHDFGVFRLKWECHTEFSTYMFIDAENGLDPFGALPMRNIPIDWLDQLQGVLLVALHIAVEKGEPIKPGDARLNGLFRPSPLVGSRVLVNGEVWTDFHVTAGGYSRILVRDTGLRETQIGRLVQRLCEIETYRMMALLALPVAREYAHILDEAENRLAELSAGLTGGVVGRQEEELLQDLSGLAVRIQALALKANFRYGAAQAYYKLVEARISELRESRIEGVPTIGEFMERRVSPAMSTCASGAIRLDKLGNKVAQAIDLLRTRVSIVQERQSQAVLHRLNENSVRQLRLQQAVEGLSVVAISYYATSLTVYCLKAAKNAGLDFSVEVATGLALPVILALTWFGLKRFQHQATTEKAEV